MLFCVAQTRLGLISTVKEVNSDCLRAKSSFLLAESRASHLPLEQTHDTVGRVCRGAVGRVCRAAVGRVCRGASCHLSNQM